MYLTFVNVKMSKCTITENDKSNSHEMQWIEPGGTPLFTSGGSSRKKGKLSLPPPVLDQKTFELEENLEIIHIQRKYFLYVLEKALDCESGDLHSGPGS